MGYCCCYESSEQDPPYHRNLNGPPRQPTYQSTVVIDQQPRPPRHELPKDQRKPESKNSFREEIVDPKIPKDNIKIPEDNNLKQEKQSKPTCDDSILSELEITFIGKLNQIRSQATPFIEEIENFTELEDSNKYYYIEESLRRLIEKLDDMHDDLGDNKLLREKRKEVYKYVFPLFDKLDEKVKENKNMIAENNNTVSLM